MKIKVGIVEDDLNLRECYVHFINESNDLTCVSTFETAEDAIAKIPFLNLDVVLMDIQLPGKNGIDCVSELKPKCNNVQFLMCTSFDDSDLVFKSLKAGASGYLLKTAKPVRIIEAINEIYYGGSPLSGQIARKVVSSFYKKNETKAFQKLSKREQQIIKLLSKGLRYHEIADKLFLSIETVRTHIRNIYDKLNVHSRTAALNKVYPV